MCCTHNSQNTGCCIGQVHFLSKKKKIDMLKKYLSNLEEKKADIVEAIKELENDK